MTIRIIRNWDDHEPVILGKVQSLNLSQGEAKRSIAEAWDRFLATQPDSDDQFITFLTQLDEATSAKFCEVEDDEIDVNLGT